MKWCPPVSMSGGVPTRNATCVPLGYAWISDYPREPLHWSLLLSLMYQVERNVGRIGQSSTDHLIV